PWHQGEPGPVRPGPRGLRPGTCGAGPAAGLDPLAVLRMDQRRGAQRRDLGAGQHRYRHGDLPVAAVGGRPVGDRDPRPGRDRQVGAWPPRTLSRAGLAFPGPDPYTCESAFRRRCPRVLWPHAQATPSDVTPDRHRAQAHVTIAEDMPKKDGAIE